MIAASSSRGGMESRTSIDTALSSGCSGGWPRPSLTWQFWQAFVLKRGPSPSRASVEAGAVTQGLRKKLLPTLKSRREPSGMFAEGCENALRFAIAIPASPPLATG